MIDLNKYKMQAGQSQQPQKALNLGQYRQPQEKSFTQKAMDFFNPGEEAKGLVKSGIGLVGGLEQLGEKVFNPIVKGITGSNVDTGNVPQQVNKLATPSNVGQSFGKGVGDIAQFFIPGSDVAKAGEVINAGIEGAKLPSLIEGGAKLASKMGLGAAEVGGVTAAQTGSPEQGKEAAKFGALLPVVGAIGGKLMEGAGDFARNLEQTSLRLTPVQKSKLGQKVGEVADYLVNNKITGTPESRYNQIVGTYKGMENILQDFLSKDAKNVTAPTKGILDNLEGLKKTLGADNLNAPAIENKIDKTIEFLKNTYKDNIPVSSLNKLKRSAYEATYNESGMKILDPVMSEVGNVLKTTIEDATKGMQIAGKDIEGFNKEYGTVINAKKLLNIAKGRPEIGLVGKLVSSLVGGGLGEAIGGPVGSAIGAVGGAKVGEAVAGTAVRSTVGSALDYLSKLGRVTDAEAGSIKAFILGGGKGELTPKEEAIAKKITEGINKGKGAGGLSISADKEAMQNTVDAVYGGLKKLEKAKNVTINDQYMIDAVTKAIENGTQTQEEVRNAIEQLKLKGIDVGTKVDTTGASLK